jgi:hypothetical protein
MNTEELVENAFDSFEIDDDVVELNSLQGGFISAGNKEKGKKHRKISTV